MTYHKKCQKNKILKAFPVVLSSLFLLLLTGCISTPSLDNTSEKSTVTITPTEIINKHIDSCQIVIPNLSRDYHLLFLTDTHITIPSNSGSEEEYEYCKQRLHQFTTDSGYVASELFPAWIDYANTQNIDGLLLGGDIIDCPTAANMEYLHTSLHSLKIPYLYTPGNHDWTFPWEYMTETGSSYLASLSPYMGNNTTIHTLEYNDFIIVAIDNSNNQIHPDALEEYKGILDKGKPVIVMLHVPLYTPQLLTKASQVWKSGVVLGGGIHGGIYPNQVSTEFLSLTTSDDSPVVAVLAGHVHLPDRSTLSDEPVILQITGDAGYKGKSILLHITANRKK